MFVYGVQVMCFHPVRRHLTAVNLCSRGWHESLEMIVSVVVGFLYMSKERLLSSLVIVIPRNLILFPFLLLR